MRLLVLGGTVFLSRAVALEALARGHQVTCACRATSGPVPDGAHHHRLDRATATDSPTGPWSELAASTWDGVLDVARTPSWVATALHALAGRARHWAFVSTINVYADLSRPAGTAEGPLLEPAVGDLQDSTDPAAYGQNKVACEHAVQAAAGGRALIVRPGLIVGPGDPTGRFSYWPDRMSRGGRVLAPAPGSAPSQVIDVRDLASWLVDCIEAQTTGVYDAVGPMMPRKDLLRQVIVGTERHRADQIQPTAPSELVWADDTALETLDVLPWSGPRSLPLWIPASAGLAGMTSRDASTAYAAGLTCRPVADTAYDTLQWLRTDPEATVTGLAEEEEADVLAGLELKPRSRAVHAALVAAGVPGRIVTLPEAATTASHAAAALGCELGAIANSLVFLADGAPLLVLASGAHRVNTEGLARRLGKGSIEPANAKEVRAATGQAIGGVAPVGHPDPLETVVDETLADYDQIWAAGGTPHTLFPTTYAELLRLTGGRPAPVSANPGTPDQSSSSTSGTPSLSSSSGSSSSSSSSTSGTPSSSSSSSSSS